MNFLKRALLSVTSRKGKSFLQIIVFSVIFVLVLSGLSIQSAAQVSGDLARQKLGGEVTLQVDMEKVREQQQESGERTRFQSVPISVDTASELLDYSHVTGYNFYVSTNGLAKDFEPIGNEEEEDTETEGTTAERAPKGMPGGMQADVSIQGVAYTDSVSDFMDGTSSIVEGRHLTEEDLDQNVILIEKTLASENELVVGDKMTVQTSDESNSLELEIVGIYETSSTGSDQGMMFSFMNPYNQLYVPYTAASALKGEDYAGTIDSAIYYMNDPENIDSFVEEASANSSIDFDTFKLDANDQLYQQMVGPIENVAAFSGNVVYLVSIAGAIILGLIVMMSIRERKYEMGVLLAIGEKRWKLIGQFIAEIVIVAVLALGIATVSGNLVANQLGEQLLSQELQDTENSQTPDSFGGRGMGFGRVMGVTTQSQTVEPVDEINVEVTAGDLRMLGVIGLLIAVLSAILPSLTVLRLQPKAILTKQD